MRRQYTFSRRLGAWCVLGIALASGIVPTAPASAASVCVDTSFTALGPFVLTNARLKKGKVTAVAGYLPAAGGALPLTGVSIVSADGTSMVFALEMPRVSVTTGGGSVLPSEFTFRALFLEPDRRLDVGDVSVQGLIGGGNATFTVIDCGGVPSIP